MKQPYFSIVIPTKNRPQMLHDAIASALGQDFDDFEVIVSDNMNDHQTKETIDRFSNNPKLNYIRPDRELNMLDHWEWATMQANGTYVILLPDRKLLYKKALLNLYKYIHDSLKEKINCVSYAVKSYDEKSHRMGWNFHEMPTRIFQTTDMIDNFVTQPYGTSSSLDIFFPKTLNSCYKNSYAESIRKQFGSYFSTPGCTTPDYSSFFINCSQNENIAYYGKPTILSQGEATSNGRQFGKGKYTAYLNALGLTDEQLYKEVPVRLPLIYNWLIIDLLNIQAKFDGYLKNIYINWDNYFLSNYAEINYKKRNGEISDELVNEMTNSFIQSIDNVSPGLLKIIMDRYEDGTYATNINPALRISGLKNLSMHFRDFVLARRNNPSLKWIIGDGVYTGALEAAGFGKEDDKLFKYK